MLTVGLAKEIITPVRGTGLAGYFNKRPNRGVLDDVYVRVTVFRKDRVTCGILSYDMVSLPEDLILKTREGLRAAGIDFVENLLFCATHTHTGSEFRKGSDEPTRKSFELTVQAGVRAVLEALANLAPAELSAASIVHNPYAFIRRFWMKSGNVVTNPGRLNPNIERPECDFDRTVSVLAVRQEGRLTALLTNIANHGDTIGGDLVSADWHGRMEREIQNRLGEDIPVLSLLDASGNINHFDVHADINQTCYAEAVRIGKGYAEIILGLLPKLEPVPVDFIRVENTKVELAFRTQTKKELAAAQHILDTVPCVEKKGDLTSEDLASGNDFVRRLFAQRALTCKGNEKRTSTGELTSIMLGKDFAFASLPGEPFNGIAQAIRAKSPFRRTFIATLGQLSNNSYYPMPECYAHGGYETMPHGEAPATDSAERIIHAVTELLNRKLAAKKTAVKQKAASKKPATKRKTGKSK